MPNPAVTAQYDELVLEVELEAGSGTFTKLCGLTGVTITRTTQVAETPVPDCDDESLPFSVETDITSIAVTMSATGVWALGSHETLMTWFYNAQKKVARLRNTKVAEDGPSGAPYAEYGPAIITSLGTTKPEEKGRLTAELEMRFDGTPRLLTNG